MGVAQPSARPLLDELRRTLLRRVVDQIPQSSGRHRHQQAGRLDHRAILPLASDRDGGLLADPALQSPLEGVADGERLELDAGDDISHLERRRRPFGRSSRNDLEHAETAAFDRLADRSQSSLRLAARRGGRLRAHAEVRTAQFAEQAVDHPLEFVRRSRRGSQLAIASRQFRPVQSLLGGIEVEALAEDASGLVEEGEVPIDPVDLQAFVDPVGLAVSAGRGPGLCPPTRDGHQLRAVERDAAEIGHAAETLQIAAIPIDRVDPPALVGSPVGGEHQSIAGRHQQQIPLVAVDPRHPSKTSVGVLEILAVEGGLGGLRR